MGYVLGGGVMVFPCIVQLGCDAFENINVAEMGDEPYRLDTGVGFRFRPNDSSGYTPSRFHLPSDDDVVRAWDALLYDCVVEYCSNFPEVISNVQWTFAGHLLSYENSQHIGWHSDTLIARYPPEQYGQEPESQFAMHLTLSALLYLNDDYEGGEIEWKYPSMSYKPQEGSVVIYPSSFMGAHRVLPCDGRRRAYIKFYGHGYPANHQPDQLQWLPQLRKDVNARSSSLS